MQKCSQVYKLQFPSAIYFLYIYFPVSVHFQVREMERIFQKRNPNSLTTLFLAAHNLEKDENTMSKESPPVMKVLEEKVKKLESELETKENLEEKRIRSVEQKYNKLKVSKQRIIINIGGFMLNLSKHQYIYMLFTLRYEFSIGSLLKMSALIKFYSNNYNIILFVPSCI